MRQTATRIKQRLGLWHGREALFTWPIFILSNLVAMNQATRYWDRGRLRPHRAARAKLLTDIFAALSAGGDARDPSNRWPLIIERH